MTKWRKARAIGITLAVVLTANWLMFGDAKDYVRKSQGEVCSVVKNSNTYTYTDEAYSIFTPWKKYNSIEGDFNGMNVTLRDNEGAESFRTGNVMKLEEIVVHNPDGTDRVFTSADTSFLTRQMFDSCNKIYNSLRAELLSRYGLKTGAKIV